MHYKRIALTSLIQKKKVHVALFASLTRTEVLRTQKLKTHLLRTKKLKGSPFKAWNRYVFSHACYACCHLSATLRLSMDAIQVCRSAMASLKVFNTSEKRRLVIQSHQVLFLLHDTYV